MSDIITFKIISIREKLNPAREDNPNVWQGAEDIVAENQGGQKLYLTRFRYTGNIPLVTAEECDRKKVGAIYQATLKRSKNPQKYNDTIEDVHYIEKWDGLDNPFFPTPDTTAADDRTASILAQSDLHTAAPIVAAIILAKGVDITAEDDTMLSLYKHHARLARQAREELTKEYTEEPK